MAGRNPKLRAVGFLVLGLLVICSGVLTCGAPLVVKYWDYPQAVAELPGAVADYKKAGLPWTATDLKPKPPLDPKENAAPILKKAMADYHARALSAVARSIQEELRSRNIAAANQKLQPYQASLDLCLKASRLKGCDFDPDWDVQQSPLNHQLLVTDRLAMLLELRGEIRANEKDFKGAVSDLEACKRIIELLGQTPSVIALLNKMSLLESLTKAVQIVAPKLGRYNYAAESLIGILGSAQDDPSFPFALRGEVYQRIADHRNAAAHTWDIGEAVQNLWLPRQVVRDGYPRSDEDKAYLTRMLQAWTQLSGPLKQFSHDPAAIIDAQRKISNQFKSHKSLSYRMFDYDFAIFQYVGLHMHQLDQERQAAIVSVKGLNGGHSYSSPMVAAALPRRLR